MISANTLSIATGMAHVPVPAIHMSPIPEGEECSLIHDDKITLRHHKRAFVGCFSLRLKKNIEWDLFKVWKENRNPSITDLIAKDFIPFIGNHYDFITTAPPSASRSPHRYCAYDLAKRISRYTSIPFVPAFAHNTDKVNHGRFSSLAQTKLCLGSSWNIRNRSILFVDDCITSGQTARLCYEALVKLNNHVDGLIWLSAA
jgi:predicted amidophosphoribosyltransferase